MPLGGAKMPAVEEALEAGDELVAGVCFCWAMAVGANGVKKQHISKIRLQIRVKRPEPAAFVRGYFIPEK
jgi:hypothetical protein